MRKQSPELARPVSIPGHSQDVKVGTACSIINALLDDVEEWERFLKGGGNGSKK